MVFAEKPPSSQQWAFVARSHGEGSGFPLPQGVASGVPGPAAAHSATLPALGGARARHTPRRTWKAFERRWQFLCDLAPAVCARPLGQLPLASDIFAIPAPREGLPRKSALPSSCLFVIDLATRADSTRILWLSEASACLGTPPRPHFWGDEILGL